MLKINSAPPALQKGLKCCFVAWRPGREEPFLATAHGGASMKHLSPDQYHLCLAKRASNIALCYYFTLLFFLTRCYISQRLRWREDGFSPGLDAKCDSERGGSMR